VNDSSFIANRGDITFPDKANVRPERLFFRLPLDRINWLTSCFLIGTLQSQSTTAKRQASQNQRSGDSGFETVVACDYRILSD
jgi:hypothetical protein